MQKRLTGKKMLLHYSPLRTQCLQIKLGRNGVKKNFQRSSNPPQSANAEAKRQCTYVYPIQLLMPWKVASITTAEKIYPVCDQVYTLLLRGFPCGVKMNFYGSLVCIERMLCLAVVSTALQKLHKCVTNNTTELRNMLTH